MFRLVAFFFAVSTLSSTLTFSTSAFGEELPKAVPKLSDYSTSQMTSREAARYCLKMRGYVPTPSELAPEYLGANFRPTRYPSADAGLTSVSPYQLVEGSIDVDRYLDPYMDSEVWKEIHEMSALGFFPLFEDYSWDSNNRRPHVALYYSKRFHTIPHPDYASRIWTSGFSKGCKDSGGHPCSPFAIYAFDLSNGVFFYDFEGGLNYVRCVLP